MKNSLVKKLGMGVLGTGILLGANSLDADAQKKKFPENHDHGAAFFKTKGNSEYSLEEKVFYNEITKKDERFYVQHIDKEEYSDDLDIASLDFYKTIPRSNLKTGEVSKLTSEEGMYLYFPEKLSNGQLANKIVIENLHIGDWCDYQIRDKAGVAKGTNYVSITDVANLFPEHQRLRLGDWREFINLTVAKDGQLEGKTNHYLIPVDEEHEVGYNPINKKVIIYGKVFRGSLKKGPVAVDVKTSIGTELGRDETFQEKEVEKEEVASTPTKKKDLYLIFGANANEEFAEGQFGIQYGPIALVANYGQGKDEIIKEITTDVSPSTGRYGFGTEYNKDLRVIGGALELHPLSNKTVSPFVGAGANKWDYTTEVTEEIRNAQDNVVKENFNSKANSEVSYKAYGGVNFKVGEKLKVGVQAGHDSKAKFNGGVRFTKKF